MTMQPNTEPKVNPTIQMIAQKLDQAISSIPGGATILETTKLSEYYYVVEFTIPEKGFFIVYTNEAALTHDSEFYLTLLQLNQKLNVQEAIKLYPNIPAIPAIEHVAMPKRARVFKTFSPFGLNKLPILVQNAKRI